MYDVIIIGRGPAGLSASLYTARGNAKTIIIGKESALEKGRRIENYCCTDPLSGEDFINKGVAQAKSFGVEIVEEEVVGINLESENNFIVTTDKNEYQGKSIIFATGQKREKVPIRDLDKYEGRGIHYCVVCDGFFYKGKNVGILGYRDYAVHELKEMQNFTKDVILYTNGKELDISNKNREFLQNNNISINKKAITKVEGKEFIEKVIFEDGQEEQIDGLFIAYGSATTLDFARKLGIAVEGNNIIVDDSQKTNLNGIFAAGDCTGGLLQMSTAVGQGAVAGQNAKSYAEK